MVHNVLCEASLVLFALAFNCAFQQRLSTFKKSVQQGKCNKSLEEGEC